MKAYTLKELVRRGGDDRSPLARRADRRIGWRGSHQGRRPIDLLGVSPDDDVTDPTGSRAVDHRTTAEEIDRLTTEALALLFP